MSVYEAPAKLNLSLLVSPPRSDGYHPLDSLVQTIEWCDRLTVRSGEGRDSLDSDIEDNLVDKALDSVREIAEVPPLALSLDKQIPVAAGMGGGSSDAAATLMAAAALTGISRSRIHEVATRVGADVAFFLDGGTAMMSGVGDEIEAVSPVEGFAVAVVVPDFGLLTREVYARWDALEGPEGDAVPDPRLPPSLRGRMPMRNDLLPAAVDLEPLLGDFIADVAAVWATTVCLTGSGTACFGYFASLDEAADAAAAVSDLAVDARGVALRDRGVAKRV